MKIKLTFDNSIPVDEEEIPNPITVETEELEDAFSELLDELNSMPVNYPVLDVKILGKGARDVTDEFNDFAAMN